MNDGHHGEEGRGTSRRLADIYRRLDRLVAERQSSVRHLGWRTKLAMLGVLFLAFYGLGYLLPADGFIGYDWVHFFARGGDAPSFYPPWTDLVVGLLNWPALIAITLAAVGVAAYERSRHAISFLFVFLALPLMWVVFLGQIDGLVVLGLSFLPLSAPLVMLKPQIAVFSLAARRSYLVATAIILLVSFIIWGLWPLDLFTVWTVLKGRYVNDISLGLWGLPIAAVLVWWSRGDIDMLMLSGAFVTPYLMPYNLIVVVPAIARLTPWSALVACILSWSPLLSNWLGPYLWWLGWAFVAWLWISLAVQRYGKPRPEPPRGGGEDLPR